MRLRMIRGKEPVSDLISMFRSSAKSPLTTSLTVSRAPVLGRVNITRAGSWEGVLTTVICLSASSDLRFWVARSRLFAIALSRSTFMTRCMPPCRSRPSRKPAGARYFFHQSGTLSFNEGSTATAEKTIINSSRKTFHFKGLFIKVLL